MHPATHIVCLGVRAGKTQALRLWQRHLASQTRNMKITIHYLMVDTPQAHETRMFLQESELLQEMQEILQTNEPEPVLEPGSDAWWQAWDTFRESIADSRNCYYQVSVEELEVPESLLNAAGYIRKPSDRPFYLQNITVTVASETPYEFRTLQQLHHDITYGACSGSIDEGEPERLTAPEAARVLLRQGSAPEFFRITPQGHDLHDSAS